MEEKSIDDILEVMGNVLLQKYPIIVRKMNVERIKLQPEELPTYSIMRIMQDSKTAQLEGEPLGSRVLIKVITLLPSDWLSYTSKKFLILWS